MRTLVTPLNTATLTVQVLHHEHQVRIASLEGHYEEYYTSGALEALITALTHAKEILERSEGER